MKVVRIVFTVLFSIMLCLLLMVLPYVSAFNGAVISSKSLAEAIVQSGVSTEIKGMIDDNIDTSIDLVEDNIKAQLGNDVNEQKIAEVKDEVTKTLKDFNKEENIDKLITAFIETTLEQKDFEINTIVKDNIDTIIKENNIDISKETQDEINSFVDDVTVRLNDEFASTFDGVLEVNERNAIVNPIPKYINFAKSVRTAIIITIIILTISIILMNIKNISAAARSLEVCLLVAGIITLIMTFIVSKFKDILLGSSTGVSVNLVENVANNMFKQANTISIIYIVIAVLIIIGLIVSNKLVKRKNKLEEV